MKIDLGEVESAARGDRQPRRDVERVGRVEAGIEGLRAEPHRRDVAGRLVDEKPGALHDRKLIGIDRSQFARGREIAPGRGRRSARRRSCCCDRKSVPTSPPERCRRNCWSSVQVRSISPNTLVPSAPVAGTVCPGRRHEIRHRAVEIGKAEHGRIGAPGSSARSCRCRPRGFDGSCDNRRWPDRSRYRVGFQLALVGQEGELILRSFAATV